MFMKTAGEIVGLRSPHLGRSPLVIDAQGQLAQCPAQARGNRLELRRPIFPIRDDFDHISREATRRPIRPGSSVLLSHQVIEDQPVQFFVVPVGDQLLDGPAIQ